MIQSTDWTSINFEKASGEMVDSIINMPNSPLESCSDIGVYMISAALAVRLGIRPVREFKRESPVTNKNLITEEMQWLMSMIYYILDPEKQLEKLKDRTAVVKNFEQYAQAGLPRLYEMCKDVTCYDELKLFLVDISKK
jgi:hypothetical protein